MEFEQIFENLKEIESLNKNIGQHQKTMAEEEARLHHLQKERDRITNENLDLNRQLQEMKSILLEKESLLDKKEVQLKRYKQTINETTNSKECESLQPQIKILETDIEPLTLEIFDLIDKSDRIKKQIEEQKQFLQGLEATQKEIGNEVKVICAKENLAIEGYQQRIHSLLQVLPSNIQKNYSVLKKKAANRSCFVFINTHTQQKCSLCYFQIERSLQEQVHRKTSLEYCPGCGRFLVPTID